MNDNEKTLGQAIDEVIAALEPLEQSARETAIHAACSHLEINSATPRVATPQRSVVEETSVSEPRPPAATPPEIPQDIRSLKEEKKPSTALEMACIVAYYLDSLAPPHEQSNEVTKSDLEKYFKQAGFKLPKRIEQVLIDAKGAGYMDSASRGKYRLNPVGHNLVVHSLPKRPAE